MGVASSSLVTFTPSTREAFLEYLRQAPNNRRVSHAEKEILIEWLTNPFKRPSSQKEFSRRNYVRRNFIWDEKTQSLFAVAKKEEDIDRKVVSEDMIVDIVESVHKDNGHAGWDATWKNVSNSFYGILRSDVIFLLKQYQICAQIPSKCPKGCTAAIPQTEKVDDHLEFLNIDGGV